jgi:hypothetical protein
MRELHMQASDLYRWSGITGIVAGAFNVLVELLPAAIGQPLDLLANILGLWVLTALYLRQREASGVPGFLGYALQSFGLAVVIGFLFTESFVLSGMDTAQRAAVLAGPAGLATVIALAIVTLGAILFGIATLRADVFPKWAALLLMIGFVTAPIGAAFPIVMTPGELILSIGLFGLSYALFSGARDGS